VGMVGRRQLGVDVAAVNKAVVRSSCGVAMMMWRGRRGSDMAVVVCGDVDELAPGWPKHGH
jgi:hypothetical protein